MDKTDRNALLLALGLGLSTKDFENGETLRSISNSLGKY
jgi:hypothetical protein